MKLTPWIDGSIKPIRAGVYERDYSWGIPYYCKFDGSVWYCLHHTIEEASEEVIKSGSQDLPWRSLAEQPK